MLTDCPRAAAAPARVLVLALVGAPVNCGSTPSDGASLRRPQRPFGRRKREHHRRGRRPGNTPRGDGASGNTPPGNTPPGDAAPGDAPAGDAIPSAPHEPFPQVPNQGGPRLVNPALITVTFKGDTRHTEFESYATWLVASSWLTTVGAEYRHRRRDGRRRGPAQRQLPGQGDLGRHRELPGDADHERHSPEAGGRPR